MIRKAKIEDCSRIAEIIVFGKRVAYRSIFQNDRVSFNELQVLDIVEDYQKNPQVLEDVLLYDDGIVKGVINRKSDSEKIEICELYVEPFFKGSGIGCKLLQAVIAEAKDRKKKQIFLWVIKDNLAARKFYEKNGFFANGREQLIEGTSKLEMCYEMKL